MSSNLTSLRTVTTLEAARETAAALDLLGISYTCHVTGEVVTFNDGKVHDADGWVVSSLKGGHAKKSVKVDGSVFMFVHGTLEAGQQFQCRRAGDTTFTFEVGGAVFSR